MNKDYRKFELSDYNKNHKKCLSIANYIIQATNDYNDMQTSLENFVFMSSKRLNKIMFFSDVIYMLEHNGQSMLDEPYYAWPGGPAIITIYNEYIEGLDLNMRMQPHNYEGLPELTGEITSVIDTVLQTTNKVGTATLVAESQKLKPWQVAYKKAEIKNSLIEPVSKESIYNFYKEKYVPYAQNDEEKEN
ncbi:MAG: DUF4065 domain-containing protein [Clostridia bacterium]|nr:DUF4065 domain-containing protein [Clostridia bacterium]